MTGHSKYVSLLTCAHACSQACSHGQGYRHQGVMYCCEVCEAKFLLFLEINKYIGRGAYMASRLGRCEGRDFSLTLLTRMLTPLRGTGQAGPSEGVSAAGRARRSL